MESKTYTYKIKLSGKSLKDFEAGKISIIDILANELDIPQENIECLKGEWKMGSYELDELNYLHYTGDGWIRTKQPLKKEEIELFKKGKLDVINLKWV